MAATTQQSGAFAVTMPLMKVWQDETGEMWFEGVASSTSLDRQQERMTPHAIEKMTDQKNIDLLPSHAAGALEELGTVEDAWVDNDQFRIAGRLDKSSPAAQRLFDRIVAGKIYGLSVGGRVTKAYWEFNDKVGKSIRYIDDVVLDHVAVCRPEAAANPDTYLSVLAKAAEAVTDQTRDEDEDLLIRIGKAAVQVAKNAWPFGKTTESHGTQISPEDQDPASEPDELAELKKQLDETLDEVRKALTELRETTSAVNEVNTTEAGKSQNLPGQETFASDAGSPWAGIL